MKQENSALDFTREFCAAPSEENAGSLAEFLDVCLERADVPLKLASKLQIAADETLGNIRAYSGAAHITCQFARQENTVTLTFSDDGIPYDPLSHEEPDTTATAEQRAVGGLGILLIRRMMDNVSYQYRDGLNVLTLQLQLPQE